MKNDRLSKSEIYEAIRALLTKACDALSNFGFSPERTEAVRRLAEDVLVEHKEQIPETVLEDVAAFRERDPRRPRTRRSFCCMHVLLLV